MDYVLKPVLDDVDNVILFDIKTGEGYEDWCGSRRTVSACILFMKEKLILSEIESFPNHDHHVILRRIFLCFGEPWWYAIFKEIERREAREAKA